MISIGPVVSEEKVFENDDRQTDRQRTTTEATLTKGSLESEDTAERKKTKTTTTAVHSV